MVISAQKHQLLCKSKPLDGGGGMVAHLENRVINAGWHGQNKLAKPHEPFFNVAPCVYIVLTKAVSQPKRLYY